MEKGPQYNKMQTGPHRDKIAEETEKKKVVSSQSIRSGKK